MWAVVHRDKIAQDDQGPRALLNFFEQVEEATRDVLFRFVQILA